MCCTNNSSLCTKQRGCCRALLERSGQWHTWEQLCCGRARSVWPRTVLPRAVNIPWDFLLGSSSLLRGFHTTGPAFISIVMWRTGEEEDPPFNFLTVFFNSECTREERDLGAHLGQPSPFWGVPPSLPALQVRADFHRYCSLNLTSSDPGLPGALAL